MTAGTVIVVGAGPAGTSAALPLLEAGFKVVMVDVGRAVVPAPVAEFPSLAELRRTGGWRTLFGDGLDAFATQRGDAPKLRTPIGRATIGMPAWAAGDDLEAKGFVALRAAAVGGLSNVWGAVASSFDEADLAGWPIDAAELFASYRRVSQRIGVSGSNDDELAECYGRDPHLLPPVALHPSAAAVLASHSAAPAEAVLRLGRARNAVLTEDLDDRHGCNQSLRCFFGCTRGAIYNAAYTVAALRRGFADFQLISETRVLRLARSDAGWTLQCRKPSGPATIEAAVVVLAAGALDTTRLAYDALAWYDREAVLLNNPGFFGALVLPRRIGAAGVETGFGMAQLGWRLALEPGDQIFGALYAAESLSPAVLAEQVPLALPAAIRVVRSLAPAMLLTTAYADGRWSDNRVSVRPGTAGGVLRIQGGVQPGWPDRRRLARRRLAGLFRRRGAMMIPGGGELPHGVDFHPAATLPMGGRDGPATTPEGEIVGLPDVFAADGSVFPSLPAKNSTFTIMANADRIGRRLAERLAAASTPHR